MVHVYRKKRKQGKEETSLKEMDESIYRSDGCIHSKGLMHIWTNLEGSASFLLAHHEDRVMFELHACGGGVEVTFLIVVEVESRTGECWDGCGWWTVLAKHPATADICTHTWKWCIRHLPTEEHIWGPVSYNQNTVTGKLSSKLLFSSTYKYSSPSPSGLCPTEITPLEEDKEEERNEVFMVSGRWGTTPCSEAGR